MASTVSTPMNVFENLTPLGPHSAEDERRARLSHIVREMSKNRTGVQGKRMFCIGVQFEHDQASRLSYYNQIDPDAIRVSFSGGITVQATLNAHEDVRMLKQVVTEVAEAQGLDLVVWK